MIAVISGQIINAWKHNPNIWLFKLKRFFGSFGAAPQKWEIFGGNAFLLKVSYPEESLFVGIIIKAIFKQIADLDVCLKIGVGSIVEEGASLRSCKGTALDYAFSSQDEGIARRPTFNFQSADKQLNENINLLLAFASQHMNDWTVAEAETVELCMLFPEKSQQEIADWLRIKQSAVSQRKARAKLELLLQLNAYYQKQLKQYSDSARIESEVREE